MNGEAHVAYNFSCLFEYEALLKVTGSHVHWYCQQLTSFNWQCVARCLCDSWTSCLYLEVSFSSVFVNYLRGSRSGFTSLNHDVDNEIHPGLTWLRHSNLPSLLRLPLVQTQFVKDFQFHDSTWLSGCRGHHHHHHHQNF